MERTTLKLLTIFLTFSNIITWKAVPEGCVDFYQHCNFKGYRKRYCGNTASVGHANDQFSSFRLGGNTSVTIFEHCNFHGKKKHFNKNVKDLRPLGFNDIISSLKVRKNNVHQNNSVPEGCVDFYEHCNYQGFQKRYCGDIAAVGGHENDRFSSFKVGPRTLVTVFEHCEYQGKSKCFSNNVKDLRPLGFNDIISSLRIRKKGNHISVHPLKKANHNLKKHVKDLKKKIHDLINKLKVKSKNLHEVKKNLASYKQKVKILEDDLKASKEKIHDLKNKLERKNKNLHEVNKNLASYKQRVKVLKSKLKALKHHHDQHHHGYGYNAHQNLLDHLENHNHYPGNHHHHPRIPIYTGSSLNNPEEN